MAFQFIFVCLVPFFTSKSFGHLPITLTRPHGARKIWTGKRKDIVRQKSKLSIAAEISQEPAATHLRQNTMPLLEKLLLYGREPQHYPFYTPGHKRGQAAPYFLEKAVHKGVFEIDLPELEQLDNLFCPQSCIMDAERLAADAFHADHTFFLVNGSSSGNTQ